MEAGMPTQRSTVTVPPEAILGSRHGTGPPQMITEPLVTTGPMSPFDVPRVSAWRLLVRLDGLVTVVRRWTAVPSVSAIHPGRPSQSRVLPQCRSTTVSPESTSLAVVTRSSVEPSVSGTSLPAASVTVIGSSPASCLASMATFIVHLSPRQTSVGPAPPQPDRATDELVEVKVNGPGSMESPERSTCRLKVGEVPAGKGPGGLATTW